MSAEKIPAAYSALEADYEIIREIGRGGTALVYLARERATGDEVAIKLIRAQYLSDAAAIPRFAREARFVAQLDHPNIVPVRAVLDLESAGVALVMAHVDGRTLKQVIREEHPVSAEMSERMMRGIANGLAAAHAQRDAVVAHSSDLVMFFESDGTIVWASPATRFLFGIAVDSLVGRNGLELIHPDDQERVLRDFASITGFGDSITCEFRVLADDGVIHWVEETATNLIDDPHIGRQHRVQTLDQFSNPMRARDLRAGDLVVLRG